MVNVGHGLMPTDFTSFTICCVMQKQLADRDNELLKISYSTNWRQHLESVVVVLQMLYIP